LKKSRLLPLIPPRRPTCGARPSRAPVGRGYADPGRGIHRQRRRCAREAAAPAAGVGGGGSTGRGRWACGPTRTHGGGWRGCMCRRIGAPSRPRAACAAATASGVQLASRHAEHHEERGSSNLPMSSASSSSLPRIGERPPLPPRTDAWLSWHRPQRHGRAAHAEAA